LAIFPLPSNSLLRRKGSPSGRAHFAPPLREAIEPQSGKR
jgi:PAS domain-containing protein